MVTGNNLEGERMNVLKQQKTGAKRLRGTVLRQLTLVAKMTTPKLREKWIELNGIEPPGYTRRQLQRRLSYRIQEMYYGTLDEQSNQRLGELAHTDALANAYKTFKKKIAVGKVLSGTRFKRRWRGVEYEVLSVEGGFEYQGKVYRSLTAVARAITGMKRSGRDFFGLPPLSKEEIKKKGGSPSK